MARYNDLVLPSPQLVKLLEGADLKKISKARGAPNIKTLIKTRSGERIAVEKLVQITNLIPGAMSALEAVHPDDADKVRESIAWLDCGDQVMFPDFPDFGDWEICKATEFAHAFTDEGLEIAELHYRAMAVPLDIQSLLNLLNAGLWLDDTGSKPYDPPTIFRAHSSFEATQENVDALKKLDPALKNAREARFSEASAHSVLDLVETIEKPTADLNECLLELKELGFHLLGAEVGTTIVLLEPGGSGGEASLPRLFGLRCPLVLIASTQICQVEISYLGLGGKRWWRDIMTWESEGGTHISPGMDSSPPPRLLSMRG